MPQIFAIQGAPGTTDSDNGAHIFGNDFKANDVGTIDAIWTYHTSSNEPNSVTVQVHRQSNQAQLATKTTSTAGFTDNAWNRVALDTPVDYGTPDELITVSNFWPAGAGGGFVYTTSASEHSANGLTAVVGGTGRFKNSGASLGDYPNQTFAGLANAVGIEMTLGGGAETITGIALGALGGITATATGLRTAVGPAAAALGFSAAALGSRTVFGTATANLGRLTAIAAGPSSTPQGQTGGGWYDLLAIEQEWRQLAADERNRVPVACPNDGEPLRTGPAGELFCPFDGWRA